MSQTNNMFPCIKLLYILVAIIINIAELSGSTSIDAIQNNITELQKQLDQLKSQNSEDASNKIFDKNFEIIEKCQDSLNEILSEFSTNSIHEDLKFVKIISKFLQNFEKHINDENIQNLKEDTKKLVDMDKDIQISLREQKLFLKIIDLFSKKETGIIDDLKIYFPHDKVLKTQEIQSYLSNYLSQCINIDDNDSIKNVFNNFISTASKSNYQDKQNIPSYVIYNCFHIIQNSMTKLSKSMQDNIKSYKRLFEDISNSLKTINETVKSHIDSNETSETSKKFLESLFNAINDSLKSILDASKNNLEFYKDYISLVGETDDKGILVQIKNLLSQEKSEDIFDHVS